MLIREQIGLVGKRAYKREDGDTAPTSLRLISRLLHFITLFLGFESEEFDILKFEGKIRALPLLYWSFVLGDIPIWLLYWLTAITWTLARKEFMAALVLVFYDDCDEPIGGFLLDQAAFIAVSLSWSVLIVVVCNAACNILYSHSFLQRLPAPLKAIAVTASVAISTFVAGKCWLGLQFFKGLPYLLSLVARLFSILGGFELYAFVALTLRLGQWSEYPDGPMGVPVLGIFGAGFNYAEPQKTILELAAHYGPVFLLCIPAPTVVLCEYHMMREVAISEKSNARPHSALYTTFMRNPVEGNGVILSSGSVWKKCRRYLELWLNKNEVTKPRICTDLGEHAKKLVAGIREKISKEGPVIDFHRELAYTVANVIFDIVLGRQFPIDAPELWDLKHLLDNILKEVQSVWLLLMDQFPALATFGFGERYRRMGDKITVYFAEELRKAQELIGSTKFVKNIFVDHAEEEVKSVPTKFDIMMTAGDLWTGGMETTLTGLRWGISFLAQYPDVQSRLREEIDERFPVNSERQIEFADLREMLFLKATLYEIVRLANVLPYNIPHRANDDITIFQKHAADGSELVEEKWIKHFIPKGTNIMLSYSSVHHNPVYFPDPYEFKPERFLSSDANGMPEFVKRKFMPFGHGKRKCPGASLAIREMMVFLVALIQNFKFTVDPENPPDMRRQIGMTSVPRPFVVHVEDRIPPPQYTGA